MKKYVKIFTRCNPSLGGYNLALRSEIGYKIRFVHITEQEKDAYIEEFGKELIREDIFYQWWLKYKNQKEIENN